MEFFEYNGVPVNGTDEVQTITIGGTPTAGSFTLTFENQTTAAITWTATDATLVADVDAKLEALTNIGTGGVTAAIGTLSSGIGTITVTFTGNLGKKNVALMTGTSSLTGTSPTLAVTTTTPGVDATMRNIGIGRGQGLVNIATGICYVNTGATSIVPTWTVVGAQT